MAKKIVFAWGRFNPPTIGHGVVMERVAKEAKTRSADYAIFASKSNDPKKNPLTFRTKIKFLKQSFPKHAKNINASPRPKTVIEVMKILDKKYAEVSMVVGSDRAAEFNRLLNQYNGKEYDFENIEIISAGERDPDAEDVTGMSASKMRKAAAEGDYKSFKKGSPMKNPKPLYDAIRKGMQIREEFGSLIESVHDDWSIKGARFNQMLRFGLVPTKYIPITQRAFKDIKQAAPNPELRKHIFDVTDKVLEYVMADDLLYRRMLLLLHNDFLMKEDQRDALLKKAHKNGFEYWTLLEVYMRGLAASPIYGDKTPNQYAFDRVNSFISNGSSRKELDFDIWESHVQNKLNTTTSNGIDVKPFKEISEKTSPGEWGTKKMADRYSKETPGQPDDIAKIKSLINWNDEIKEVAPPGKDAESFIKSNKEKFKKRYGDNWERILYSTAWKVYGNKDN
jgi:nicotinic acid mononucleotide adenylyltransferase